MRYRTMLGPLVVAAGVWCAAGQLAVVSPDAAAMRIAAPASIVWFAAAWGAALLVPRWRREPLSASPALLACLPWLPLPLPPVALVWTGALAWVPIGLAVFSAASPGGASGPPPPDGEPSLRRSTLAAAACTLLLGVLTAWSLAPRLPGGDEPHYLVITQSLLGDGDLDIANNHANRDYAAYYGGVLNPDRIQNGRHGEVYSIHAPGTSVLVLPGFALLGYRGAQATLLLLAALAGALVWRAGWWATGDRTAAWFGWAAVVGSSTFLFQSATIFPDGPGAAISAAAAVVLVRVAVGVEFARWQIAATGAALAILPWLHTRFSVLAAGLGASLVWRLLRAGSLTLAERWRRVGWLLFVPLASAAAWFGFFYVLYGTPNPAAPYGPDPQTSASYVPGGMIALAFDEQFGLFAYTPVLVAGIAGSLLARGATRGVVNALVAVAIAYAAAVATYWMWWGGVPATPARFAAAALPLLAVPAAVAWRRSGPALRAIWRLLLVVSIAISIVVLGVDRGALAWNYRNVPRAVWLDWLNAAADLPRGLPSFFWRLNAGVVQSELPFAIAVVMSTAIAVLLAWLAVRLARRLATRHLAERTGAAPAVVACWWLAFSVMAVLQAGWWWNGINGLEPARAQLDVLGRHAAGRGLIGIGPFGVFLGTDPSAMRIQAVRADPDDGTGLAWLPFSGVPAGTYRVDVAPARSTAGDVTVQLGRVPIDTFHVDAADPSFQLSLPAGAAGLTITPDAASHAAFGRPPRLIPVSLVEGAAEMAVAMADYAGRRVYFLDDAVFVEGDGFWVRGGRRAAFAIDAAGPVTLDLANGASSNDVVIETSAGRRRVPLQPSESRRIVVPASASGGPMRVALDSPGGFRPSEMGPSRDARYLGVRVTLTER